MTRLLHTPLGGFLLGALIVLGCIVILGGF